MLDDSGHVKLTLLVVNGNREEYNEGHNCQQREEKPDEKEVLEALEPGPPVVLQVHDVSYQGPKCQNTWGTKARELEVYDISNTELHFTYKNTQTHTVDMHRDIHLKKHSLTW